MISSFLSKLLLGRQLDWNEQGLKIIGKNFCVQPIEILVHLQNSLRNKNILYKNAKDNFYNFSKEMIKHAPNKEIFMRYMLSLIDHLGFGQLKIVELKPRGVKLQLEKNHFAITYRKIFGKQKKPVDYILAGIVAGFFSVYFEAKMECKENFCMAQGKNVCSFLVHP